MNGRRVLADMLVEVDATYMLFLVYGINCASSEVP